MVTRLLLLHHLRSLTHPPSLHPGGDGWRRSLERSRCRPPPPASRTLLHRGQSPCVSFPHGGQGARLLHNGDVGEGPLHPPTPSALLSDPSPEGNPALRRAATVMPWAAMPPPAAAAPPSRHTALFPAGGGVCPSLLQYPAKRYEGVRAVTSMTGGLHINQPF